jgi:hypothetical protein
MSVDYIASLQRGLKSHVRTKHRQYLKRAARRIAHQKQAGHLDAAKAIEQTVAKIVANRLLKRWPYND